MMDNQERLPDCHIFEADGHVSEVVLTCLADGELALVPAAAVAHVDGCDSCTARMGAAALRSIDTGEALQKVGRAAAVEVRRMAIAPPPLVRVMEQVPSPSAQKARRPIPYAAVVAALVVAIVAGAPGLLDAAAAFPSLLRSVQVLARVVVVVRRSAPEVLFTEALLLQWTSAVVLLVAGCAVVRAMTRSRLLQGGMG
jgi:hypothetical protein